MTSLQEQARALGDPTRWSIFRRLATDGPTDVATLTSHFGVNHNAIRQHLAKLVRAELVVESKSPRTGPGRPRHLYAVDPTADGRWDVTGPYERLSGLLSEIIRTGDTPVAVGRREGRRMRTTGEGPDSEVAALTEAMAKGGFEPQVTRRGSRVDIVLRNCPFESTALVDPETICGIHLGIAEGLTEHAEHVSIDGLAPTDPAHANCHLHLHVGTDDRPPTRSG